jgi:hypothetical protein
MKNTIIGGCFALVAAVLAVYLGHYLTKENIDVRYTLSDSIPANFLGKGSLSNIQQLDIINRGDKTAEKIRINLDKSITQYELTKYSTIDKVQENLTNKNLEILYPELPPEGKIKIVFSSDILPLIKDNIKIYHSKGVGKEAFDEKNSFIFSTSFLPITYILLVVGFGIVESFIFRNKWLERDAYRGDKKIFTRKKSPWFMNVDRWDELRKEAIENYIKRSSFTSHNIDDSVVVVSLNSEKPEYLKDHEWELLINESQNFFVEKIPSLFEFSFYYERNVERFFKLDKPKYFQQNRWNDIVNKLHKLYIFILKESAVNNGMFESAENIYKKITSKNHYCINEKLWNEYLALLNHIYKYLLINGLYKNYGNYIAYIENHDLSILDKSDYEFVKEISYKLQKNTTYNLPFALIDARKFINVNKEEWVKDNDYKELKDHAQEVIALHAEKERTTSINSLLNQIRFRQPFPTEKPNEINDEEWNELRKLEKDLVELLAENKEVISKNEKVLAIIEQKEKSIPELIDKINFQLSVINEFLSDHTVLDRIEDYNNKFSPGNFHNLKQIAAYLKILE